MEKTSIIEEFSIFMEKEIGITMTEEKWKKYRSFKSLLIQKEESLLTYLKASEIKTFGPEELPEMRDGVSKIVIIIGPDSETCGWYDFEQKRWAWFDRFIYPKTFRWYYPLKWEEVKGG